VELSGLTLVAANSARGPTMSSSQVREPTISMEFLFSIRNV
jgi:hypothetical protein